MTIERGGRAVLHDVDASIAGGRVTGLFGPSGSGKSTLIRAIAGVQSGIVVCALTLGPLGLRVRGPVTLLVVLAVCVALLGTGLGLLASAFARTEFQVVQFFPLIILPQLLLCGLLVARDRMPSVLHAVSDALRFPMPSTGCITFRARSAPAAP